MTTPDTTFIMRPADRLVRIVLPDGIGMIEIATGLHVGDNPRVRVDVISDQPRYGDTARDGRTYKVTSHPERDGIVYLDGHEPEPDREAIEREGQYLLDTGQL